MMLNSKIDPSTIIKQSQIGQESVIGKDCVVIRSEIGNYCDIDKRNLIRNSKIGDMTYTGSETNIMWAVIGKYCCISRQVEIGGNEHNYLAASMMPTYRLKNRLGGKLSLHHDEPLVTIGNDVWIGQGVSILRKEGLTIGNGAVIGSGAVVTRSIPPYAIAVGVPARVIKYRFSEEIIERLQKLNWWEWSKERILETWPLLSEKMTAENLEKLERISLS